MLQVSCTGCKRLMQVPLSAAGKQVRCSSCREVTRIPAAAPVQSDVQEGIRPPQSRRPDDDGHDEHRPVHHNDERRRRDDDDDGRPPRRRDPDEDADDRPSRKPRHAAGEDEEDPPELGRKLQSHVPSRAYVNLYWLGLIAAGTLFLACVVWLLLAAIMGVTVFPALSGLIFGLLGGGACAFTCWDTANLQLTVYQHGFVYTRRDKRVQCRWDDIVALRFFRLWKEQIPAVGVDLRDGEAVDFQNDELPDFDEFAKVLERKTHRRLLQDAEKQLDRGDRVEFGEKLQLDEKCLHTPKRKLRWDNVKIVIIGKFVTIPGMPNSLKGLVRIVARDEEEKFIEVNTREVSNLRVFSELVRQRFRIKTDVDPAVVSAEEPEEEDKP